MRWGYTKIFSGWGRDVNESFKEDKRLGTKLFHCNRKTPPLSFF